MNKKVLILGASGNFGSKIAKALAKYNINIVLAGRRSNVLLDLKKEILRMSAGLAIEVVCINVQDNIEQDLKLINPFIVINASGPFQLSDYSLPMNCANLGIHYMDLADGREFVNGFSNALNHLAKAKNCLVVSGASTVPCLSSAVLNHYKAQFSKIISLKYGIAPGLKSDRGLATTQAILSYAGKPLSLIRGQSKKLYGWQDLYRQSYPDLGKRWMANCDIPDLDLFPKYYDINNIQFSAGLDSNFLHLSLWILSWLVRFNLPINLQKHANLFLKLSHLFDRFGSDQGGMHMIITGKDKKGNSKTIRWFIIAKDNDGPYIPTIPSIILTKKLLQGDLNVTGAMPCVNLISLEEYLAELEGRNVTVYTEQNVAKN